MNTIIDYLYDFSISLTYEIQEAGSIDIEKFVKNYLQSQGIDTKKYNKILVDYSIHFVNNTEEWFSDREEIENWYSIYSKK